MHGIVLCGWILEVMVNSFFILGYFLYLNLQLFTGSVNDSGIWSNTAVHHALENNTIFITQPRPLPNGNITLPFAILGDEAFPLKSHLMRSYPRKHLKTDKQRVFNYRLSRTRRIVENAFGILAARWRILFKPLCCKLPTGEAIIQAIVCLHNFIIITSKEKNNILKKI